MLMNLTCLLQSGGIIQILFPEQIIVLDGVGMHPISPASKCWKQHEIIDYTIMVPLLSSEWRWEWEMGSCFLSGKYVYHHLKGFWQECHSMVEKIWKKSLFFLDTEKLWNKAHSDKNKRKLYSHMQCMLQLCNECCSLRKWSFCKTPIPYLFINIPETAQRKFLKYSLLSIY